MLGILAAAALVTTQMHPDLIAAYERGRDDAMSGVRNFDQYECYVTWTSVGSWLYPNQESWLEISEDLTPLHVERHWRHFLSEMDGSRTLDNLNLSQTSMSRIAEEEASYDTSHLPAVLERLGNCTRPVEELRSIPPTATLVEQLVSMQTLSPEFARSPEERRQATTRLSTTISLCEIRPEFCDGGVPNRAYFQGWLEVAHYFSCGASLECPDTMPVNVYTVASDALKAEAETRLYGQCAEANGLAISTPTNVCSVGRGDEFGVRCDARLQSAARDDRTAYLMLCEVYDEASPVSNNAK